jgi:hypothetical protein
MAAPADEREHAFTIPKVKLRDFSPSSAPADYRSKCSKGGNLSRSERISVGRVESTVARVGPVAKMILIVEDAVRFDVADSAPRAAITSSKPQNVGDAPLAPSRRATP